MAAPDRKRHPLLSPAGWVGRCFLAALLLILLTDRQPAEAVMENHFLYFPDPHLHMTPAHVGLAFEEVVFPAADGIRLHGWFIPGEKGKPVVLFCHGNAGNIAHRIDNLVAFNRVGLPVFIFDYRGYGRSQGTASETGLYDDARGAQAWLEKRGHPASRTVYFGRSIGAAVALQLALEREPAALVLESPFTSLAELGKLHYPILYRLFGWLIPARYDNAEKITRLNVPLLVIHGSADTIVPVAMGKQLFRMAPEPKRLELVEGADHNDGIFLDRPGYWAAWTEFLDDHLPSARNRSRSR